MNLSFFFILFYGFIYLIIFFIPILCHVYEFSEIRNVKKIAKSLEIWE